MSPRECRNPECRTLLSRCDGRGMQRCAKCVRMGIGKKIRTPRKRTRQRVCLDVLARQAQAIERETKRRGL